MKYYRILLKNQWYKYMHLYIKNMIKQNNNFNEMTKNGWEKTNKHFE